MRSPRPSFILFLLVTASLTGCGDDDSPRDSGATDGGSRDAARMDAGGDEDGGTDDDAGDDEDAGVDVDGGADEDAGADAGMDVDAGPGPVDSGPGPVDSGPGPVDSGPPDSGPPDAGPPACGPPTIPRLMRQSISGAARFTNPLFVTQAPGSTDTLWVVQRGGLIRLVRAGAILATSFLDVTAITPDGGPIGESGLLGLAFHPDYEANGRFFIYYTDQVTGANVLAEYRRMAGMPDRADPTPVRELFRQADTEANHNGGMLAFGPDGFLYVGMGDEGGGCDLHGPAPGNAQRLTTIFGKILRLDVDAAPTFAAAGNPFTMPTGDPRIFHLGVRNPWRFSFDQATGDFYLGDVGQNTVEEVDVLAMGTAGGVNFGWRRFEGDMRATVSGCPDATLSSGAHTAPEYVYDQAGGGRGVIHGCAVTGGYVYRGSAIPELDGVYFFGDYCDGTVAAFRWCEGTAMGATRVADLDVTGLSSFGQDNAGEIYIVSLDSGRIDRVLRR